MNFIAKLKLKKLLKKAKNFQEKRDRGNNINVQNEIKVYRELAKFYEKHTCNKKFPHADILAIECYRTAAIAGDAQSQYIFAEKKLAMGRFWNEVAADILGRDIHKTYAKECFDEAFNYLSQAEKLGYPLARRLHGMAYINGWGVAIDQNKGFKMVVDSIEEEHAWDRATQIFAELGLNKPEFFQAIMAARKKS